MKTTTASYACGHTVTYTTEAVAGNTDLALAECTSYRCPDCTLDLDPAICRADDARKIAEGKYVFSSIFCTDSSERLAHWYRQVARTRALPPTSGEGL